MVENDDNVKRKAHRSRQAGVKAEKKKAKQDNIKKLDNGGAASATARERNPKAFAINSAIRAERNFRRKEDITAKKQHIPVVDQTTDEPPPDLIAVVGPPKVGKTTLISNLIKSFTKTNVNDIRGPITIVTSKKRRITLLECNNDINTMIDVAKCADLVLLLIDASYGFEMEIFEFLNICQVHGMPKIMGVLTHLDMMKNPAQIRKRKKELKHRFWTEVYNGAKLFYLSGLIHGEYLRNEIQNLGRFISIIKYRPLQWRGAHSYLLADRVEDVTNSHHVRTNPACDRDVVLYGYVRGVPLKKEHMVHIAGVGDMRINEISLLQDPCPLPGTVKKRSLLEKERLLYAPMSGVGGLVYDKDAVYIELSGSHSHNKPDNNDEKDELMEKLIQKRQTVDIQTEQQEFRLFSDGSAIKSKDYHSDNEQSDDSENEEDDSSMDEDENTSYKDDTHMLNGSQESDAQMSDDDDEASQSSGDESYTENERTGQMTESDDEENATGQAWKNNLMNNARESYLQRHSESKNLMRLVYSNFRKDDDTQEQTLNDDEMKNNENDDEDDADSIGSLFKSVTKKQKDMNERKLLRNNDECCFFADATAGIRNWLDDQNKELIVNCFITGKWKASEDAEHLLSLDKSDDDSEIYGDFEDLEAENGNDKKVSNEKADGGGEEASNTAAKLIEKKLMLKEKFNSDYDKQTLKDPNRITGDHEYYESLKAEAQKQSEINKNEFKSLNADERIQVEGYRAGFYVRLGFKNFPAEFIEHFDATYPVLIGGLNAIEENIGFVQCKVKKHRWYKKILKSADPLIISLGWRRFQTCPIYAKIEDNLRYRYLKYTPNHVTCAMSFWGPVTPQNTGFLALQSVRQNLEEIKRIGFRIAATGSVMEVDKSTQIMKKLKLVGVPFKIYKKSAFIKGMFTTSLEVAKFEGAKVKTVSGIRGQIKKAHHTPEGSFRATFEDKILLSDIVFCRTWFRVDVPRFYTPLTTLLLPPDQKSEWQGMKTVGQLKREKQIKNPAQPDSSYTEIKRQPKIFKKLVIPKALQRALPYKDKPKFKADKTKPTIDEQRIAVIRSPHEQKVAKLMKTIETNFRDKRNRDKTETKARLKKFKLEKQMEEMRKQKRQKELRKKVSRAMSKIRKKEQT